MNDIYIDGTFSAFGFVTNFNYGFMSFSPESREKLVEIWRNNQFLTENDTPYKEICAAIHENEGYNEEDITILDIIMLGQALFYKDGN